MRKIPGIYVEIKGDSTQLRKDMAQTRQLVTESARGMSDALNNALSPGQIKSNINSLIANLGTLSRGAHLSGQSFDKLGVDLGQLQKVTGVTGAQFNKLQSQMLATSAAKAQEKALRDISRAANLTEKEVRALGTQMGLSKAQISNVAGAAKETGRSFDLVGSAARAALAYFSVSTMASFGKAVFDVGINLDSLQRSFTAIAGSTAGMRDEFAFLRQTAEDTGQNFYKLADGYKMLIASSRETQLEGEETRKIFSAMSEAAAVLGMSTEGIDRSFKALGQMMSKGTVQAEELKNQLGDHLPGALQIAASAMDMSTKQLMKMMETGDVLATDLLPKLADELHRMYGEAAKTAALESGQAAVNRLSQSWTDLKANLYDSEAAVEIINRLANSLKTIAEYANLRSVWGTFTEGMELANKGLIDQQAFIKANFRERQKMVDDIMNSGNVAANHFTTVWQAAEEKSMREYQQFSQKQKLAISSAYEQAYSTIGGMAQEVYDKMKQKYTEDRDAFIKLTGDKETAYAVFAAKIKKLDQQKAGKAGTSKASDMNAALGAELEYLKAAEERKLAVIKAAASLELQNNQNAYDIGLKYYKEYIDTKQKYTEDALRADLAAKEKEYADAKAVTSKLSPITDKEGNARPDKDNKARSDALKREEVALKGVIEARNRLDLAHKQGAAEVEQANTASLRSYQALKIQFLEMTGQFEAAAAAQAKYGAGSVERIRLEEAAAKGEADAIRELSVIKDIDAHRNQERRLSEKANSIEALIDIAELNGEFQKSIQLKMQLLDVEKQIAVLNGASSARVELYQREREELDKMTTAAGAFAKSWKDATRDWGEDTKRMADLARDLANTMHGSFEDLFFDALQGDMKSFMDYFKGFLTSMNRALADFWAKQAVSAITGSTAGGAGWLSWITGLVGATAGASSGGGWTGTGTASVPVSGWHSGGSFSQDQPSFSRMVDPAIFDNAPRYHGGLMPKERAVIIEDDETIFTKGQMAALGQMIKGRRPGNDFIGKGDNITVHSTVDARGRDYKKLSVEMQREIEDTVIRVIRKVA